MSDRNTEGADVTEQPAVEIPPLGAVLRRARESRGESLSDVAVVLKLAVRQIEAIEQERFGDLPGPAFVKGFVRNYGRHVGVDVEPMIAARWGGSAAPAVELKPMTRSDVILPEGQRSRGRKLVVPVIVLGVAALALAWYFDGFDPNAGNGAAEQAELVVEQEAEGFAPPQPEDAEPAGEAVAADVVQPLPQSPALIELPERLMPAVPAVEPAAPAPEAAAPVTEAVVEPVAPVTSGPGRAVFRLDGESWIEVRDARDRRLYSGSSQAGAVRVVQGQPPFAVVIGNARAVRVEYAGSEIDLRPHTSSGGVARLTLE